MASGEPSALEKSEQNGAAGSGKKEVGGTSNSCQKSAGALPDLKFTAALPTFEAECELPPPINFEVDAEALSAIQFEVQFEDPGEE